MVSKESIMKIGDQLLAPDGFDSLEKNERYSFLKSDSVTALVSLVRFSAERSGKKGTGRRVALVRLPQARFEKGLLDARIIKAEPQYFLPPWLRQLEGINLEGLDFARDSAKQTNRSRMESRYAYIHDLVERVEEILAAKNPFLIIGEHARHCQPRQHKSRIAEWFFSYVCFGRRLVVLYPEFSKCGIWSRDAAAYEHSHFGRPSLSKGRHHGYASPPLAQQIMKAYSRRAGLGKTLKSIYQEALLEDWGCDIRERAGGKAGELEFFHPEGLSFPNTYGKFYYQTIKNFGLTQVQKTLYGAARVRLKIAPSIGKYTEEVTNAMERVEFDAFYLKERATSIFSSEPMPRLCVVRAVCVATKCIVGIGFSLGSETAEAYLASLFSMAIPKELLFRLLGIPYGKKEWPCEGLAPHLITDRGAAPQAAIILNKMLDAAVKEMTPSYSGQSKASVESSHPRDVHLEGAPSHLLSKLNIVQMVQREVFRVLRDNHSSSVADQVVGQRVADGVLPTAHELWCYLDGLGRNDAYAMPVQEAVQKFLKPIKLTVKHDGVWLCGRNYSSAEFLATKILDKVASGQTIEVGGYSYSMCVRFVWIEIDHRIIEIEAKLPYRDDKGQLFITMEELQQEAEMKRGLESARRTHSDAANAKYMKAFTDATGQPWAPEIRRGGPVKPMTSTVRAESRAFDTRPTRRATK
jgi:hypothetical protein